MAKSAISGVGNDGGGGGGGTGDGGGGGGAGAVPPERPDRAASPARMSSIVLSVRAALA